ncbi:hypothetical protein N431DRAFT_356552 [Stipitochalara longipes BDJ]|nr:hypothetical protein N431DRAFT_356552 [Stipitochalara longipes BDJ]
MLSANASAVPTSAQHTWRIHKSPLTKGRQGKLDPKHRLKIKLVREMRACLRCSIKSSVVTTLDNIDTSKCSQDDICIPCRKLVEKKRHTHEKRTLSFCGCVRTCLGELNLFEFCIPPPHAVGTRLESARHLALRSITLCSSSETKWDLSNIVLELVEWLSHPHLFTTSNIGLLSSPNFLDLVAPYFGAEIGISFQHMLYAESLAYTQPTSDETHILSVPELQQNGAVASHNVLTFLDRKLRSELLKSSSKNSLEAAFVLLVGTLLAAPWHDGIRLSSRFQAMQAHLCQILAHYVVYISSRLNLPLDKNAEKSILEAATRRRHTGGIFLWSTVPAEDQVLERFRRMQFKSHHCACDHARKLSCCVQSTSRMVRPHMHAHDLSHL